MIKLMMLRCGKMILDYVGSPKCNHKGPYKRETRGSMSGVGVQADVSDGRGDKDCRSLRKVEETRNSFSPGASRREQPCRHLDFRLLVFRTMKE